MMSLFRALIASTLLVLLSMPLLAATATDEAPKPDPMLLGACSRDSLLQEPYVKWFEKNHDDYTTHAEVLTALRKASRGLDVTIFFGSWCGDSKREVPRFLKLLDDMSVPAERVHLIGVASADSVKKQSPQGEERGQHIYRVPTMIVRRDGREIGRIVEYPVLSLERDLLAIVSGKPYTPNYHSYPKLTEWLQAGLLADENVSYRGLAEQVRPGLSGEGELHAAASVLEGRGDKKETVKVLQMNAYLYPESARARLTLAEALHETGDDAYAERMLKKAMELDVDGERRDDILELWDAVRASLRAAAEAAAPAEEEE